MIKGISQKRTIIKIRQIVEKIGYLTLWAMQTGASRICEVIALDIYIKAWMDWFFLNATFKLLFFLILTLIEKFFRILSEHLLFKVGANLLEPPHN